MTNTATFIHKIRDLIESVDFEKKEAYIYLKNGLVLFMKGEIEAVKAGVLISDIGEESIISWSSIAGFKILKKVIPREGIALESKENTENVGEIDSEELGMEKAEAREGYDDR